MPKDDVQTLMWNNLAAAQSSEKAIKNRNIALQRMTPADVSAAKRMARERLEANPR